MNMSVSRMLPQLRSFAQKKPLLVNAIIYGSFYTSAEFVQQTYNKIQNSVQPAPALISQENAKGPFFAVVRRFNQTLGLINEDPSSRVGEYNWPQLKRYAIFGCFLAGPVLHGWYKLLDGFYKGKSVRIVVKKLIADQFLLTPPLLVLFFTSMSLMEGKTNILAECKAKFVTTFQTSCMYWLPVQFVNFALIPPALRVSFVSIATFCWANILCYLKNVPHFENEIKSTETLR